MAPLAGKPPFATDEPDSVFAEKSAPVPRPRKQKVDTTATGGARDSAYTTFDSYFTGNGPDNRLSGGDDIGRGLMSVGSDDSSDDEHPSQSKQTPTVIEQPSDKHRALYAAATGSPPPSYDQNILTSNQDQKLRSQTQHPDILSVIQQPRPAVHAHGTDVKMERPLGASVSSGPIARFGAAPSELRVPPAALQSGIRPVAAPSPAHSRPPQVAFMQNPTPVMSPSSPAHSRPPQVAFMQNPTPVMSPINPSNPFYNGARSGHSTRTPQPLPPPPSPIMPVFARPRKESNAVKFEEKGEILRGNSEETLLPRGVGGKGDDFWRRFSMVAREEAKSGSKKSAWLKKTESGSTRLSAWVWIAGIILLIAIGGGIGVGWFFTHNKPAGRPIAIGGSANEGFTSSTSNTVDGVSTKATRVTAAPEPTNTTINNKRNINELLPTPVPVIRSVATVPAGHRRSFVDRIHH